MDPTNKDPVAAYDERILACLQTETQILETAQAAGRDLTDDERTKITETQASREQCEADKALYIRTRDAQARIERPAPRKTDEPGATSTTGVPVAGATTSTTRRPITGRDVAAESPTHGFESGQAWFRAIAQACANPSLTDRRLTAAQAAATTFANEGAGDQGGWAMPPDYAAGIVQVVMGQASLLGRMRPLQSNSNIYQVPVDETTDWGTSGVQPYKTAEGAATTVSNIALAQRVVTLYKASALVNVSEELSTDNPAAVTHITRAIAGRLNANVERWILRGSGVGEPLGILNAPALVSVGKDSAQTADTITRGNLAKCAGRLIPGTDANAFWVASPSAKIGMLDVLLAANGNDGTNLQRGFGPTVLGYPIVTSMEAAAIGDAGDCTIVAPEGFLTLVKGGIQSAATIYFYFDQGLTTLRAYLRLGQVPLLSAAVTPKVDTATTLSHCVTTEARA